MKLHQKQKTFSEFFLAFSKSILTFKHLSKRMTRIADVFPDIPPPKKIRIDKCLKSRVSEKS